jgi:hypothetical protein
MARISRYTRARSISESNTPFLYKNRKKKDKGLLAQSHISRAEILKSVDRKLVAQSWKVWEENVEVGIAHRPILQEFCYYEKNEDPGHGPLREEMIRIVRALYRSANGKELNCDEVLLEREKYTQGPN